MTLPRRAARRAPSTRRTPRTPTTSRLARWRATARLARRQTRRARGSSILVVMLVALPIATLSAFLVVTLSTVATPEDRLRSELGRMQAWVAIGGVAAAGLWQAPTEPTWTGYGAFDAPDEPPEGEPPTDPLSALPSGTETIRISEGSATVDTPDGVANLPAWIGPAWDPRFTGRYDLVEGTRASRADEAMVSPAALTRLGIETGDTIVADGARYTVSGTLQDHTTAETQATLFLPETARPLAHGGIDRWYLPELSLDWSAVRALNSLGLVAYSRDVVADPPEIEELRGSGPQEAWWRTVASIIAALAVGAAFAAYVVAMLAGAAFAVSARRQQRVLAIAASTGATRADLRRVIVWQGTTLGSIGGVAGVVLGVAAAAAAMPLMAAGGIRFWGFRPPWPLLLAVLALAVLVGTVSALAPARAIARVDAVRALRGGRRPAPAKPRRPLWGALMMLTGIGITLASGMLAVVVSANEQLPADSPLRTLPFYGIVAGPVLAQLGILVSGRWLLTTLARALSRLGVAARIAARDAASGAARSVPAFAAITATVFLAVFALAQLSMQTAQSARDHFLAGPQGALMISFYGEWRTPAQPSEALAEARRLARQAGAGTTATVSQQTRPWGDLPQPAFALALLPGEHLLDTGTTASYRTARNDPSNNLAVVAPEELADALGVEVSPSLLAAYRDGAAVVADARYVSGGEITVAAWDAADGGIGGIPDNIWRSDTRTEPVWQRPLPARSLDAPAQPIAVAIAPTTAERLGLEVAPAWTVSTFDEPPSSAALERLSEEARAWSSPDTTLATRMETGPPSPLAWVVPLLGATTVLVLAASAVAIGLARVERRDDDATLAAVGATPGLRRRIGLWQALILTGIGSVAGAAAGALPAIGFAIQSDGMLRLEDVPWSLIAATALALPAGIAAVSWLVPPRRPDLTRRTAIT